MGSYPVVGRERWGESKCNKRKTWERARVYVYLQDDTETPKITAFVISRGIAPECFYYFGSHVFGGAHLEENEHH